MNLVGSLKACAVVVETVCGKMTVLVPLSPEGCDSAQAIRKLSSARIMPIAFSAAREDGEAASTAHLACMLHDEKLGHWLTCVRTLHLTSYVAPLPSLGAIFSMSSRFYTAET